MGAQGAHVHIWATTFDSFKLNFAPWNVVGNIDKANYFIKWQTSARRLTWRLSDNRLVIIERAN